MVVNIGMTGLNHDSRNVEMVNSAISVPIFHVAGELITYCNQSFLKLFRLSPRLDQAYPFQDFFVHSSTVQQLLSQCTNDKPLVNVMVQCKDMDNKTFWANVSLACSEDEYGAYYYGTLHDQTEIIEREKLLRQRNEDLKKLNSQLDRFIYSTSHDIRQPVASIMGLISLMEMENPIEEGDDYLSKIKCSVNRLDQFITKILQFSQNSHEHVTSTQIDLKDLVTEKLGRHAATPASHNINLSVEISDNFSFYSDAERLGVALHHILKNCFDYHDASKTDPYVKVLVTTYADRTIIEVIDNGIGISKAHVDKVTGMFYRGTERSKGSGLGLYIVNEIAIKLNATLRIDSELGLGTMVTLEIPNGVKGQLINRKKLLAEKSPS